MASRFKDAPLYRRKKEQRKQRDSVCAQTSFRIDNYRV